MYIHKLRIKNYRNFADPAFEIALKPFTLILGENNAGKSNLLNALGLLFSQDLTVFRKRFLDIDDFNYASVRQFREKVADGQIPATNVAFPEVKIEVFVTDMNDDQQAVVGDWFCNAELTEAKLTYHFAPRANFDKGEWVERQRQELNDLRDQGQPSRVVDLPLGAYAYSIYGGDDPTNDCDPYYLRMLKLEFLDALRDAQRELAASGEYRLLYRILSHRKDEYYGDIQSILRQLKDAINNNANLSEIKQEVAVLLELVSLQQTESDNEIGFTFDAPNAAEMLKKIGLQYGTDPVRVERNGLGRNNLLYISLVLSHLASRDTYGNETFFRIVALEEPESHLHPHLQDHLARNIEEVRKQRDKDVQLLMTSHSTHIAAHLKLENTVILYRDQASGRTKSHYALAGLDSNGDVRTINYLSRYLDATKSRMFFARKLILVEGISEQLLVPRFFELHCSMSLERAGCTVINVQGVAFNHFLKVVKSGFFVRCLVLTDQDASKRTARRAERLREQFDEPGLIQIQCTTSDTFELDLFEANRIGPGRLLILAALHDTLPTKTADITELEASEELDTGLAFSLIQNCKAEFAFSLATLLESERRYDFIIPNYIATGFNFLV